MGKKILFLLFFSFSTLASTPLSQKKLKIELHRSREELVVLQNLVLRLSQERAETQHRIFERSKQVIHGLFEKGRLSSDYQWERTQGRNLRILQRRLVSVSRRFAQLNLEYKNSVLKEWQEKSQTEIPLKELESLSQLNEEARSFDEFFRKILIFSTRMKRDHYEELQAVSPQVMWSVHEWLVLAALVLGVALALIKGLKRE